MRFDQLTASLDEPLTNERIEELKADWRADGLGEPPSLDDYITLKSRMSSKLLLNFKLSLTSRVFIIMMILMVCLFHVTARGTEDD